MSLPVLTADGVAKKYCSDRRRAVRYAIGDVARELVPRQRAPTGLRAHEFWAVDGVSLEVRPGEALAVVGSNGAGKSTLLKVLCGLFKPDRGEVRTRGRLEAIIELGTGVTPQLTGRENIRLGATLHGLGLRATRDLVEEVVDFSELGRFIDAPVDSYSTGMKARLSYALASHLRPDVLLLDEVLAVGDLAFQRKCLNHMRAYLAGGGAIVLVSHNTYHVQSVCHRGLLLEQGRVRFSGTAVATLNQLAEASLREVPAATPRAPALGPIAIEAVTVAGSSGAVRTGEPMRVTMRYRAEHRVDAAWGFGVWTNDQWVCITGAYEATGRPIEPGVGELECVVPRVPLLAGRYVLRAAVVDPQSRDPLALYGWQDSGVAFDVRGPADKMTNGQAAISQLTSLDVAWG